MALGTMSQGNVYMQKRSRKQDVLKETEEGS